MQNNFKNFNLIFFYLIYLFVLIGIGFLILNFLSLQCPVVGMDEVGYNDPGINLFMHGKFYSTTFSANNYKFWALNVPFYQFILSFWLKLVGFSGYSIHQLHIILAIISSMIFFEIIRVKNNYLPNTLILIVGVLFFISSSLSYVYLSARPESLAVLIVLLIELLENKKGISFILLFPLFSILFLTSIPIAVIYLFLNATFKNIKAAILPAISYGLSLTLIVSIWFINDVFQDFLENAKYNKVESMRENLLSSYFNFIYKDFAILSAFVCLLFIIYFRKIIIKDISVEFNKKTIFLIIVIPIITYFTVKLNVYYTPIFLIFSLYLVLDFFNAFWTVNFVKKYAVSIIILILCFGAVPIFGRFYIAHKEKAFRNYKSLNDAVKRNINTFDTVYSDNSAYYSVKGNCSEVYTMQIFGKLTNDQKESINKLVINPYRYSKDFFDLLPNNWKLIDSSCQLNTLFIGKEYNDVYFYERVNHD